MNKVKLSPKPILVRNLLLIEGITRSGKFLVGNILDGLERVEHYQYAAILEHLPYMLKMRIISEEVAVSFLQNTVDEYSCHQLIGRNMNFRVSDLSSLARSPRLAEYRKRMTATIDALQIIKNFTEGNFYNPFIVHEGMPNINLFFKAYPQIQIISIQRHPVDLIHSWYSRGLGEKEVSDPLSFQPCLEVSRVSVPWYLTPVARNYYKMPRIDRVIFAIKNLYDLSCKMYGELSPKHKKQILFITFENLTQNSLTVVKQMAHFLQTEPVSAMSKILARERCPRLTNVEERGKRIEAIRKKSSEKLFKDMMHLATIYEQKGGELWLTR